MVRFYTVAVFVIVFFISGCSTTYPNRTPFGEVFPTVSGQNLEKERVELPRDIKTDATLLLIGYVQDAQFDIDRWLIALDMTETNVPTYEIPTIGGMFPRMFKTYIDNGMRKGIPKPLWKGVITVYEGAEKILQLTGNENPNNARVLLLGEQGKVIYFYDQGFAVEALKKLRKVIADVKSS
ncbi:hypothetical protein [Thalassotalea ganghwensis]